MKQNLIADVVQGMLPYLNNAQTEKLQEVLKYALFSYEVTKSKNDIEKKRQEDEMWKRRQEDEMWRKHEEEQQSWDIHETSPKETGVRIDSRKKNASKRGKHSSQPYQSPMPPNDEFYDDDIFDDLEQDE